MQLPKNEKRQIESQSYKKIWIYGAPFSGKTYFANQFPDVLFLNTDGNIKFVNSPYIAIKDEIKMDGRIKNIKYSWEIFTETIDELEKHENDFKTIVVDLLEDVYDACRVKVCKDRGWSHESDDSFKAYDIVRNTFLRELKRLTNLKYNIILLSHEDAMKDITKKSGDKITSVRPNINDKLANKIAGLVDIVGRQTHDEGIYKLCFKQSEVEFGGGRLAVNDKSIRSTYEDIEKLYTRRTK